MSQQASDNSVHGRKRAFISSTSSGTNYTRRPKISPVASPYEANYSAEANESLFEDLEIAVFAMLSPVRRLALAVQDAAILYSQSWLVDGFVGDKNVGKIEPAHLIMSLNTHLIPKAAIPELKSMAATTGMETMIKDIVSQLGWTDEFAKIVDPDSKLIQLRKDVLKAMLFVARVYCAMQFLKLPMQLEGNLRGKVHKSLAIVQDHADLSPSLKRKGRKSLESKQAPIPIFSLKSSPRRVSVPSLPTTNDELPLTLAEKSSTARSPKRKNPEEDSSDEGRAEAEPIVQQPSKMPRISLDDLNPADLMEAVTKAEEDGRLDQMELFFRKGLQLIAAKKGNLSEMQEPPTNATIEEVITLEDSDDEEQVQDDQQNSKSASNCTTALKDEGKKPSGNGACRDTEKMPPPSIKNPKIQLNMKKAAKEAAASENSNNAQPVTAAPVDEATARFEKALGKETRMIVRSKIFRNVKFFKNASHLERAVEFVAEALPEEIRKRLTLDTFSERLGNIIIKALGIIRNEIERKMRPAVLKFMDGHQGVLPTIDDLTKLRKATTPWELECFKWFWDSLLECVSGRHVWGAHKKKLIISDKREGERTSVVSVSDEAFTLLAYENYRDFWNSLRRNDVNHVTAKAKYTCHRGQKLSPWGEVACRRFEELHALVKADRKADSNNEAEKRMLARVQSTV